MDYFLSQPKSLTVKNWVMHYKYNAGLLQKKKKSIDFIKSVKIILKKLERKYIRTVVC